MAVTEQFLTIGSDNPLSKDTIPVKIELFERHRLALFTVFCKESAV